MVNGKKVIAVCVSKANNEENLVYLKELHTLAKERGYLAIVYYLTSDVFGFNEKIEEDAGIFKMINYDYVDALIIVHDNMMNETVINELVRAAKEKDKPRIVIGAKCDEAFTIEYQGDDCFESIVRHVIEDHGCRDVYFFAGVPDMEFSVRWIDIYKKVLAENGIPYDENKVKFGYYWKNPTYEIMEELIETLPHMPEAIICANDFMAITVCRCLNDHGYYVPENIIVTGFDGIVMERYHHPRLTTGVRDEVMSCDMAMEVLDNVFGGTAFTTMYVKQQYRLAVTQSCGCEAVPSKTVSRSMNDLYDRLSEFDSHEGYVYKMAGELSGISDKKEMCGILSKYIRNNSYIAIRDCIWNSDGHENVGEISYDETVTVVRNNKSTLSEQKKLFPLGIFLPNMDTVEKQESLLCVFPLRYTNQLFGYYVVRTSGKVKDVFCHSRFVNMANLSLNMVLNSYKLCTVNARMADMQTRDALTGIYNSHGFIREVTERYLDNPQNRSMILVAFDIGRLRSINEAFGHDEGDAALIALADIIKSSASVDDVCARYGSDEFLCAIFTMEDCEYIVYNLLNSVSASVRNHNTLYDKPYTLVVNHAYAVGKPENADEVNLLVKTATERKQAKKDGRGGISKNAGQNAEDLRDYQDFCRLVENNQFRYVFQPIVNARSGEIYGYEALMRSGGDIQLSPLRIIDLATKFNRLSDIEHATFHNVPKLVEENHERLKGRKVFINSIISAALSAEEASELIEIHRKVARQIVVEVTEQTATSHVRYTRIADFLRQSGIEMAIDDYGTGYANTSRIIDCIPDYVKIDRSLITGIHFDYRKQHFVTNIIKYAHDNGFKALAEGVENASELKAVIRMGIDLIQGYYTARPSYEIVDKISKKISADMLRYAGRQEVVGGKKTYVTGTDITVDLYDVMVNQYSEILVTGSDVFFKGNKDNPVPMVFTLEDNTDYTLTFRDVQCSRLEDVETVKIGRNSNVTLIFEGDNKFMRGGITVPESSSLKIIGNGSLSVAESGVDKSCIGGSGLEPFGDIDICLPGGLNLLLECDSGVAIGGINCAHGKISLRDTAVSVKTSTAKSVGIGSLYGDVSVKIYNCRMEFDMKSRQSVAVGSIDEEAEISIKRSKLKSYNEGDMVAFIGTLSPNNRKIEISETEVKAVAYGKYINCIGADGGEVSIDISGSELDFYCEGASVMCFGTRGGLGSVRMADCDEKLEIKSNTPMIYSVNEDKLVIIRDKKEDNGAE